MCFVLISLYEKKLLIHVHVHMNNKTKKLHKAGNPPMQRKPTFCAIGLKS